MPLPMKPKVVEALAASEPFQSALRTVAVDLVVSVRPQIWVMD